MAQAGFGAMTGRLAIVQLARLLGKEEFYRRLPLAEGAEPSALDAERVAALRSLVDERLGILTEALAVEAVVNDDVIDAASAMVYLEDRLAFFGELLTEEQRRAVRKGFARLTKRWG
ncbi:MAG: hypothetical protein A2Z17_01115 [Gammaproteobacteria bacterium RBG_16_66_13]|jgi:hypothetical protein|nr:MAG: hypothetical protein A2Z17_01115 [Gammaproteobacteria bacterium RBG_16_66_13]